MAALADAHRLGGDGGLIAISAEGGVAMPYTSEGMKRAALLADGAILARVFEGN